MWSNVPDFFSIKKDKNGNFAIWGQRLLLPVTISNISFSHTGASAIISNPYFFPVFAQSNSLKWFF